MSEPTYIGDAIAEAEAETAKDREQLGPIRFAGAVREVLTLLRVQSGEIITDSDEALAAFGIQHIGHMQYHCIDCGSMNDRPSRVQHDTECSVARARSICGDQT